MTEQIAKIKCKNAECDKMIDPWQGGRRRRVCNDACNIAYSKQTFNGRRPPVVKGSRDGNTGK